MSDHDSYSDWANGTRSISLEYEETECSVSFKWAAFGPALLRNDRMGPGLRSGALRSHKIQAAYHKLRRHLRC
jgi:hypothetical protein